MMYPIMKSVDGEEKEKLGRDLVAAVGKEVEPLLKDAAPFFGGSKVMTLAEVRPTSTSLITTYHQSKSHTYS
jgi:glutathione S-transferase